MSAAARILSSTDLCDLSEEGAHQMFRRTPMALLSAPRAVAQPSMPNGVAACSNARKLAFHIV
jgi:hypothetical protein